MLASRRFGVPNEVTASNARTLEHASYHVRTELGVSTEGYRHSEENPIFGTGRVRSYRGDGPGIGHSEQTSIFVSLFCS